jgi:hypothetical protein
MQDGQLKWLYEGPSIDFLSIHPFSLSISGQSQGLQSESLSFRSKTGSLIVTESPDCCPSFWSKSKESSIRGPNFPNQSHGDKLSKPESSLPVLVSGQGRGRVSSPDFRPEPGSLIQFSRSQFQARVRESSLSRSGSLVCQVKFQVRERESNLPVLNPVPTESSLVVPIFARVRGVQSAPVPVSELSKRVQYSYIGNA